jgi:hypothetical protein
MSHRKPNDNYITAVDGTLCGAGIDDQSAYVLRYNATLGILDKFRKVDGKDILDLAARQEEIKMMEQAKRIPIFKKA